MGPSLNRFKGRALEPISQRKTSSVEQPLLLELLPAAALHLAASLSDEEKEVLIFMVLFGRNALLSSESANNKSPWKPWKSFSSKVGMRQQVCTSCPFSGRLDSMTPTEEGPSKYGPLAYVDSRSFSCDCFTCYSRFWSRWNASSNRNIINDILEVIESIPQGVSPGSKGKKKKKSEKIRKMVEMEMEKAECPRSEMTLTSRDGLKDDGSHALGSADDSSLVTMETGPSTTTEKTATGRKKGLFRGSKQREKPLVIPPNATLLAGNEQNVIAAVVSMVTESESGTEAVAIEMPENLPVEPSSFGASGLSLTLSRGKSNLKPHQHHRIGKRRSNQITPLDCEDVPAVEREQQAVIELVNTEVLMSPRVADAELGGRGFLARVFPDALGRVASRLWDLVSVRLRSRTVEYH